MFSGTSNFITNGKIRL